MVTNKNFLPIKDMQEFLEHILNLNLTIKNRFFTKTIFEDPLIEEKFQNEKMFYKYKKFVSDFLLILSNMISIFYIFFFLNKFSLMMIFLINISVSIILVGISFKYTKLTLIIDHINVFCLNTTLAMKLMWIIFVGFDDDEVNFSIEILRIIIYHFVLINIIILLKFPASFFIFTMYFIINLIGIILSLCCSSEKEKISHYEFEAIISFGFTYIIFGLSKIYENLSRKIFSQKYKYETFYEYTFKFINGLNNNHMVIKDEKIIFINQKFSNNFQNFNNNNNNNFENYNNSDANLSSNNLKPKIDYISILKDFEIIENDNYYNVNDMENSNGFRRMNSKTKKNLWDILLEIKNKKIIAKNEFYRIGVFQYNDNDKNSNKFYTVIVRSNDILQNGLFHDVIFIDVSDFLSMRKKIYEENLIKEKVMAKLAHELKTPINSIIGLINKLNENENIENNNIIENTDISNNIKSTAFSSRIKSTNITNNIKNKKCISSLSNYTLYLVNDIIQYF